MISPDAAKALSGAILKLEYYEQQKTWIADSMKKEKQLGQAGPIAKQSVVAKVRALIKSSYPALEPTVPGVTCSACVDIFRPAFYQVSQKGWTAFLATCYGLSECRLHLEGEEIVFGIPIDAIDGETLGKKEQVLSNMAAQQFLALVDACGFSYKAVPGSLVIIPGRFAVVTIGGLLNVSHGMTWFIPGGKGSIMDAIKYTNTLRDRGK